MLEYCYSEHQDIQKLHTLRMSRPSSTVCLNGPISTSRISSFCKHSIQLQRLSHCDTRRLWATVKPSLCKSRKPVSVAEKYGDGFAHLDHINQYFACIVTDPNYDPDELCHLRCVAEDNSEHSGAITCEYEVHSMLSSVKKTSPGVDDIPYWVFKHCAVELTPVVTYLIHTIVSNGTPPPTYGSRCLLHLYLRRLHQQIFLIYGPYQSHQFCLVLPRDLLFENICCLPYPLTNLPISLHTGPVDLLPLP